MDEPIIDYLRRRLRGVGRRRWSAIAEAAGIPRRMPERIAYAERNNPTLRSVQPLLDYFAEVDRGERVLPEPESTSQDLSRDALQA